MQPAAPAPAVAPVAPAPAAPPPAPAVAPAAPAPAAAAPAAAAPAAPAPAAEQPWSPVTSGFALSADRLMGLSLWKATISQPEGGPEIEASGTQLNLLLGSSTTSSDGAGFPVANSSSVPRAAFDFILPSGLTLGGALGYYSASGETKTTDSGVSVSQDDPSISGFIASPRLGYLIQTSPLVSIWLRGGITVYGFKVDGLEGLDDQELSIQGTQLTLDPSLVLTPVEHFGILLTPVIDQALTGNWEVKSGGVSVSENFRLSNYGVAAGLVGFF